MTFQEVLDVIEAYDEVCMDDCRFQALTSYNNAVVILKGVNSIMGGGGSLPELHELYPNLFDKPTPVQQSSDVMKARIMAYAEAWKQKNK